MSWLPSYIQERAPVYGTMALDYLNQARNGFNKLCVNLEPWQIVAYTLGVTFIFLWLRRQHRAEKTLFSRMKSKLFRIVRKVPWVQAKIEKELSKVRKDIEDSIHKCDRRREFHKVLPESGLKTEDIVREAESYQSMTEFLYQDGRVSGAVYTDEKKDHKLLLTKIFDLYAYSNPLHPDVFPGCRKMEAEIIHIICNLFHGGPRSCGTTTTGGTESILLACLAYRNRAYANGIEHPEMVIPVTAHAAFDKAGELFCIRVRHVPVNPKTMQVDVKAMKRAIGPNTCMLVGSTPNFPCGTIDPIEEISRLGESYGIPVHVDACLGGFLIAFMEKAGYPLKPFDFRLPAVTSISCDTHKYGFAPKGSSIIMYREEEYLHHQYFCIPDWPGGIYATPTLTGSRCGANIALTWATLLYYGERGYVAATKKIVDTTRQIRKELEQTKGIRLVGSSDTSVVAFSSDDFNIYSLSDRLNKMGWNLNTLQNPAAIHLCVTTNQTKEGVAEKFVDDVRQGTKDLLSNPESTKDSKTAAIYGMAASVPDKTLVEDVAFAFLDSCFATPSLPTGDADSHHHNGKESKADKHSSSANGWAKAK